MRGGSKDQEGGDIRRPTADSCCCIAEANTILRGNYPPINKK